MRQLIRGAENLKNAIIFCNRKRDVAVLHKSLQKHGFSAGALHGDMDQRARMTSLDAFKSGDVNLLVCSDVAARGLDIPDVSHVFNFDVPTHAEDYVHRIGRTGRAGRSGVALSIVTSADRKYVDEIEKLIARKIDWQGGATLDDVAAEESVAHATETRRGRGGKIAKRPAPQEEARPSQAAARGPKSRRPVEEGRSDGRKPSNPPRSRRSYEDDDVPVVGLGDHVPMFLLRPVKLKSSKNTAEKTDSTENV